MNQNHPRIGALALIVFASAHLTTAIAATTSFTYQGRLFEGTTPATGLYDLRFTLYNAAAAGTAVGQQLTFASVPVTNGIFTVTLDFGAVFDGGNRWLEVAERTNEFGSFTTLSPRQFLTSVPMAAFAANAGKAMTVAAGAVDSAAIAPGAVTAAQLAPGAAAANLMASGQSGVGSGGMIMSGVDNNPDLLNAGYVKIGKVDLVQETWKKYASGPTDVGAASQQRSGALSAWTGTELILWGGLTKPTQASLWPTADTATAETPEVVRYNPALDSWTSVPLPKCTNVWDGTSWHEVCPPKTPNQPKVLVWTGSEVLVYGDTIETGMRYDPGGYEPIAGGYVAPSTEAWTYTETVGARYNPASGTWSAMSPGGPDMSQGGGFGAWCGNTLVVWAYSYVEGSGPKFWGVGLGIPPIIPGYGSRYDPAADKWSAISLAGAPASAIAPTTVWTGTELLLWGGYKITEVVESFMGYAQVSEPLSSGARYNPQSDTWTPVSTQNAPQARYGAKGCWTGNEIIVWGGVSTNADGNAWGWLSSGGRYDPAANKWLGMATAGAPARKDGFSAVWAGDRMIVWGGETNSFSSGEPEITGTGAAYRPSSDTWTEVTTVGAPSARMRHSAVWTGTEMLVWGGENRKAVPQYPNVGGRYNPALDQWTLITFGREPGARQNAGGVWTGTELLVWGGDTGEGFLRSGGRFDPALNSWRSMTLDSAPSGRSGHTTVWTGTEMLIWGGANETLLGTGGRYNPATDKWTPISIASAPAPRQRHTAVWTGSEMLVWGGEGSSMLAAGGRYNPATDAWGNLSTVDEPTARTGHTGVWTGTEMIVWGGKTKFRLFRPPPQPPIWIDLWTQEGARYNPTTDTWTPMITDPAPEGRCNHAAVWTGKEMIVWGGTDGANDLRSGGKYSPATGNWSPISATDALTFSPESSAALWDGAQMILVQAGNGISRYVAAQDRWYTLNSSAAPGREKFVAVWTGTEVLVWGGNKPASYTATQKLSSELYGYTPAVKTYLYLRP